MAKTAAPLEVGGREAIKLSVGSNQLLGQQLGKHQNQVNARQE